MPAWIIGLWRVLRWLVIVFGWVTWNLGLAPIALLHLVLSCIGGSERHRAIAREDDYFIIWAWLALVAFWALVVTNLAVWTAQNAQ
jgi:hypothetical protein